MNGKPNLSSRLRSFTFWLLAVSALGAASSYGNAAGEGKMLTIVAFGDSLTAGYMLLRQSSFPAQLQVALAAKGYKVTIGNAGVSGDTTSGGLERFEWTLQTGADAVILELGANDALRGTDPKIARDNLDKMLGILKARNIPVLLAGMKAPANWGAEYKTSFDAIYPDLAAKYAVPLYPFFLEGVALDPALVQADGLHPTDKGVAEIVRRILPQVEALVKTAEEHQVSSQH
jgi:acyl-CoA thioesterase-1